MQTIRSPPPRITQRDNKTIDGLSTATHVFIRHDAVRKPLQPPYDGPYPVIKRMNKHFTNDINGRHDTVSVDRLKPAHLDTDTDCVHPTAPPNTPPCRTTRSGRHVHFPRYLARQV